MAKRNKKSKAPKMSRWAVLPQYTLEQWLGQFLTSSIVMKAWEKTGKLPKKIRVREGDACIEDQPDGSGLMHYEATF